MKKQSGFTLIEILVVLTIGMLLVGFGFMSLKGFSDSRNLDGDTEALVAMLKSAQEKSLSQEAGVYWAVYIYNNSVGRDYFSLFTVSDIDNPVYNPANVVEVRPLKPNNDLVFPVGDTGVVVVFKKLTGEPKVAQTIEIQGASGGQKNQLTVSPTGKIDYTRL